ncbi:MAG: DUF4178 domain-containing protein [Chloroflexi bacterium]|nr:DUF4178 domain-containing protein [Chloroflexota bacterium]
MEIRQLQCPNCGSAVSQQNPTSQTLICPSCHSHLAVKEFAPELLSKGRKAPRPLKPIELGSRATLHGTPFVVLGRVNYVGWDTSDTSDRWVWDEWMLGADDGRILWLSFDDEAGFVLYHKKRIKYPINPISGNAVQVDGGTSFRIHERYPAQIVGAEGELTWQAQPNDQVQMIEGAGMGRRYSIQYTPQELEMYEGIPLNEPDVATAFGDKKWANNIREGQDMKFVLRYAGAAAIIFAIIGAIIGVSVGLSGDTVTTETVQVSSANPAAIIPLELDNQRPVSVSMKMQNTLPTNTWAEVDVSMINPDGEEVDLFSKEYWHETGVDEDGSWDESDYNNSGQFVPASTGQHQLKVSYGERSGDVGTLTMEMEVKKNRFVQGWFWAYGGCAGVLGLLLLAAGSPKTAANMLQSFMEDDD